jgi:hypothetical protein
MASSLKVNFLKSCLVAINVDRRFLEIACDFLNCVQGVIPFNDLGLPGQIRGRSQRRSLCYIRFPENCNLGDTNMLVLEVVLFLLTRC